MPAAVPLRRHARRRLQSVLLVLGAGFATALMGLLWTTLQLEQRARALEVERATAIGERILRQAVGARAAFAHLPEELRFGIGRDGVLADETIGWLHEAENAADRDVVVEDRLLRAARAEFGSSGDAAAATREFDELLAGPLPPRQRVVALAAAAWQAKRAGSGALQRLEALRKELDERLGALAPGDLGSPTLATAVASALRLPRAAGAAALPPWAVALAPFLPAGALPGLELPEPLGARAAAISARRARLAAADDVWRSLSQPGPDGLAAGPAGQLLWWQTGADGVRAGAWASPAQWFLAVTAACGAGELSAWPWLVEPDFGAAQAPAFAGVPFLRGLREVGESALVDRPWLLPAITATLLVAFAWALLLQWRASRREAAAVQAQADFLTTVTHELKTPLASIRLLGEMLAEGRARGREAEYYRMLSGEAERLSMLIENVLDLGRLERGERAYDLRALDVGEVVRETVALFAPDGAGVVLREAAGPCPARLDRGALVQALVCVLDNARKYGGGGPIEVVVDTPPPTPGAPARVQVAVRDRGAGVPEGEREAIFERFVRGSSHAHGSTPGVGIGLYLARTIARRLHGDLVCGTPLDGGPGALFTFHWPLETTA